MNGAFQTDAIIIPVKPTVVVQKSIEYLCRTNKNKELMNPNSKSHIISSVLTDKGLLNDEWKKWNMYKTRTSKA